MTGGGPDASSFLSGALTSDFRYQGLLQVASTDVWWADADGRLLSDLPAWRAHTRQSAAGLLGTGWLDAVKLDHRGPVAEAWCQAVAARAPFEREFPIVGAGGGERVVFLRAQPVGRAGEPTEWLGTVSSFDRRRAHEMWLEVRTAETLRRISAALVSELDLAKVVQHVTDAATELVGAEFGAFFYNVVDDGREKFVLSAQSGATPEALADFPTLRGERTIRVDDVGEDPRFASPPGLSLRSYLAAPVQSRTGDVLGALFFGHARPGVFTAQHEWLVEGLAAPAAIAIDNARLFDAAEREREAAQRLAQRLAQMGAVSARLAGAKMVDEVAEVIVTGAVAALGSARASLHALESNGRTLRLRHAVGYEGALRARWEHIDLDARVPATDALRDRRLMIIGGDEDWARYASDAQPGADRSVALAVIPLALGEQRFGVATFGWDEPRTFEDDEAQFLEALADQCSQALERARLYEVERETARTLRQSLLPPRTPEIPGLEVAALYRAGDRSVEVGGDFYDVFRISPNRWGVSMGDVCGRGASAAARTALVRHTLRAVAACGDGPLDVLRSLNDAMLAEPESDDRFCATIFGHVELDRGGASVTLVCAGHPRPIVIRRTGWIDYRGQPGTLVGVVEDLQVTEDRIALDPGDALLFCTDGIWEARNSAGEQFADEALPEVLLASAGLDAETVAQVVQRTALDFSGGTLGDDLAILVLRAPDEAERDAADRHGVADLPLRHEADRRRPLPPREARTLLPAHPSSPRAARRFLADVLASWRMPELLEGDAALLLSELATNAILHAASSFSVIVRFDGRHLRVEVGDGSRDDPHVCMHGVGDAPGGHGLRMIDSVSRRWGILPTDRGKRVWFELAVPRAAVSRS